MKLGKIALKIRLGNTRFEQRVFGAADLETLTDATLTNELAFVIPLSDSAPANTNDNSVNQLITENFGVVVALKSDVSQADKTGLIPSDLLHTVREEIFKSVLGWQIPNTDDDKTCYEGLVYYIGGTLINFNRAWLWWQFTFGVTLRIDSLEHGVDVGTSELPLFEEVWAQYILNPDDSFSMGGRSIPLPVDEVDAEQQIK